MAFIRKKKISVKDKTYVYAYAVENKWTANSSRQKVIRYCGRVYSFNLINDTNFFDFYNITNISSYLSKNTYAKIVADLIKYELFSHGVDKSIFSIDLENLKIKKGNKEVSIEINEGMMNNYTLGNLFNFSRKENEEEKDAGYRFAKAFVESGIKIPEELFTELFDRFLSKS